jgi:hypothetical protein
VKAKKAAPNLPQDGSNFVPIFSCHRYKSRGYKRVQYIIDPPGSFDGSEGSYKVLVDDQWLTLNQTIDDVITDQHHVHSYLSHKYGRTFGDDSSKVNNWKEATKAMKQTNPKLETVFRIKTPIKCQKDPANDLENPGVIYVVINRKNKNGEIKKVPVLIVELKSETPLEDDSEEGKALTGETFMSPDKTPAGVKGETAEIASLIQMMLDNGVSLEKVKKATAKSRVCDAMDVDGMYETYKNKRSRVEA